MSYHLAYSNQRNQDPLLCYHSRYSKQLRCSLGPARTCMYACTQKKNRETSTLNRHIMRSFMYAFLHCKDTHTHKHFMGTSPKSRPRKARKSEYPVGHQIEFSSSTEVGAKYQSLLDQLSCATSAKFPGRGFLVLCVWNNGSVTRLVSQMANYWFCWGPYYNVNY